MAHMDAPEVSTGAAGSEVSTTTPGTARRVTSVAPIPPELKKVPLMVSNLQFNQQVYVVAFATLLCVTLFSKIPTLFEWIYIPYVIPPNATASMLLHSVAILIIGSYWSLLLRAVDPMTGRREEGETVKRRDAMLFPVTGSLLLLGLYLAYTYLSAYWINLVLTVYLLVVGGYAVSQMITRGVEDLLGDDCTRVLCDSRIVSPKFLAKYSFDIAIRFTLLELLFFAVGAGIAALWSVSKDFMLSNLMAVAFAAVALRYVSVGDFKTASLLLCGLFFYDVFWVFGTDVMVTVAKNFDGPAKILFPLERGSSPKMSLLGLGDIVLPGLMISMALRFDAKHTELFTRPCENRRAVVLSAFSRPYFWTCVASYTFGLTVTAAMMLFFNRAQPALLYLVPSVLLSFWGSALWKGELEEVLSYTEEEEENTGEDSSSDTSDSEEDTKKNK